jgi:Icc-related predicted phosphoesterase
MRILAVADLHYNLPQFDWLISVANRYDLLIIAGDLLDGNSFVTTSAQMVVVLKYLERLRAIVPLVVCSGNHDLNHAYSTGERYARWVPYARGPGAHADNETFTIGEVSITVCPWWDGDIARQAIGRQLAEAAETRERNWFWVYHAPPAEQPVSWSGSRHYGDVELAGWIAQYQPQLVFSGHVHEAPFARGGSWASRLSQTWVFNPGRQVGEVPTHIIVDTELKQAAWFSFEGAGTLDWGNGGVPEEMLDWPAWLPRAPVPA